VNFPPTKKIVPVEAIESREENGEGHCEALAGKKILESQ